MQSPERHQSTRLRMLQVKDPSDRHFTTRLCHSANAPGADKANGVNGPRPRITRQAAQRPLKRRSRYPAQPLSLSV